MLETDFNPSSIVDIRLRSLNGGIARDWKPKWLKIELSCNLSIDDDTRQVLAEARIRANGSETEDSEPELTYEGDVTVQVVFDDDAEIVENNRFAVWVLVAAWPYMRAALSDHARRVGAPPMSLPMELDLDSLDMD